MKEQNNMTPDDAAKKRNPLEPGRPDRNLLSDSRDEAPIDQDMPNTIGTAAAAGDETYADEDDEDPDYFEKRAGDDVRK